MSENTYLAKVTSAFLADYPDRLTSLTHAGAVELSDLLREFMEWLEDHNGDLSALQIPETPGKKCTDLGSCPFKKNGDICNLVSFRCDAQEGS